MKKCLAAAMAAMTLALGLTIPASASGGKIIYEQNFDSVTAFADLGWESVETLTSNTAQWIIVDGKLEIQNNAQGCHDSYVVMVPESTMREVIAGDYTVQYDLTYLDGGDTSRYMAVLLNYDRISGKSYNSLHIRIRGSGNWQTRRNGEWITLDTGGVEGRQPIENSNAGQNLAELAVGVPYGDKALINQTFTVRQEVKAGEGVRIYVNDVFITGTNEQGWKDFMSIADPINGYAEIALKAGGTIHAYFDNFVLATGIGIPEPAPETTAAPVTEPAPETTPAETTPPKTPDLTVPAPAYAITAVLLATAVAILVKRGRA